MRKLFVVAVIAGALTAAQGTAFAASASRSAGSARQPTAGIFEVPWKQSVTVCLGKARTRKAISYLNHGQAVYAFTGLALTEIPGFWTKMLKYGAVVDGLVAHRWARDTAKAYLHSHGRGAIVRVGVKGAGPIVFPWWDARKRGAHC